jgi:hypothetical protein
MDLLIPRVAETTLLRRHFPPLVPHTELLAILEVAETTPLHRHSPLLSP